MHQSLGEILRKARETSGFTVEDIVFRTKIPRPVIEALETENFGFFTSPLYARSFLKQYGESIGANVEPWLADFIPAVMVDSESLESILGNPETPSDTSNDTAKEKNMSGFWSPIWILLITLAIIWIGVKIYEKLDSSHVQTELSPNPTPHEEAIPVPSSKATIESTPNDTDTDTPKRAIIVEPPPQ